MENTYFNEEMPYERFLNCGPEHLSDAELLAIILRTGTSNKSALELARDVLRHPKAEKSGLLGLYKLSLEDLMQVKGIGEVKAVKLKSLTELSMRFSKACAGEKLVMNRPETVAEYYMEELRHRNTECVYLACFDVKCHLLTDKMLTEGTVNMALISPREIFLKALVSKAVQIILIHNHPSGDPRPSDLDVEVTKNLKHLGEELEIPLIDHIIIGDHSFYSFRKEGLLD